MLLEPGECILQLSAQPQEQWSRISFPGAEAGFCNYMYFINVNCRQYERTNGDIQQKQRGFCEN